MSQTQADRALELLYGDASARDELTDEEAQVLLKWGEDQLRQLAAQELDDASFDEAVAQLLKLLSRINRFTARRVDLAPEEQQASLDKISASAAAVMAYTPSAQAAAPDFQTYLQQQGSLDNIANIQTLTALIAPAAAAATPPVPPAAEAPASPPPLSEGEGSNHPSVETPPAEMPPAAPPTEAPPSRWWNFIHRPASSPTTTTGDDHDETQQ